MTTAAKAEKQTKFLTPVFRVSYANVFKARKVNESDPAEKAKFSLTMIWPKKFAEPSEQALFDAILAAVRAAGEAKWGPDRAKWPTQQIDVNGVLTTVSAINSPFNDGAKKAGDEAYGADKVYAAASSEMKPGIVGVNRVLDPITGKEKLEDILDPSKFYSGCYARAKITVYPYDNKRKGVGFGLRSIQFIRDGEPLAGGGNAADDFDSITPPSGAKPSTPAAAAAPAGGVGFGV